MNTVTSRDGTRIAYDTQGTGPVLIYITGALCHRRMRDIVRDAAVFARSFTVVTYDRRGRGDSDTSADWSLDRELDDVEALIDAKGGRALLYGHSSGAVIAMHAAHCFGDRVDAAALYDASWVASEDDAREYATLTAGVDDLLRRDKRPAAIRRFLIGIGMPKVFSLLLPLLPGWSSMKQLAPTLRCDMALTASPPPLDVVAGIKVPLHVMVGGRSPAELHTVADALARSHGTTPEVFPGQDHLIPPDVLLPSLTAALLGSDSSRSH